MAKTRMARATLEALLVERMRAYEPAIKHVVVQAETGSKAGYTWDVVQITGDVSPPMLEKIERKVIYPLQKKIDLIEG